MINLAHKEVRVRRPNSHLFKGEDKFTGSVTYSVVGRMDGKKVRLALGTDEKVAAIRRVSKIEKAVAEGPASFLWYELREGLPANTFKFFADHAGFVASSGRASVKNAWKDLYEAYEFGMQQRIAAGKLRQTTCDRYISVFQHFASFLVDQNTPLSSIDSALIERYKTWRRKAIAELKQSRGASSIALDTAVLHGLFKFAVEKKMMAEQPIDLSKEHKPGKNPKNGARSFTAEELTKLRSVAGKDFKVFLFLRWTGLRGDDAINVRWKNVHFDRGFNGEIEFLTKKRGKTAIVPLATELREALEEVYSERKPSQDDFVLHNAKTGKPFVSRARLYHRMKLLGNRAGVIRVTPHCFRDTFACDMLARGNGVYDVAKMLADTVKTVEDYYAQFIPASRDAAQAKMDNGIGIEERARLIKERGRKVVGFPG